MIAKYVFDTSFILYEEVPKFFFNIPANSPPHVLTKSLLYTWFETDMNIWVRKLKVEVEDSKKMGFRTMFHLGNLYVLVLFYPQIYI